MIREHYFPTARSHYGQTLLPHQFLKLPKGLGISQQIIALRATPALFELGIVDKYVWRAWGVGPVFQIEIAAVQNQRIPVRVKRNRGKLIVVAVVDQRSFGRVQDSFGKGTRGQERVKNHKRQTRRVKKDDHHHRGSQKRALPHPAKCSYGTDEECQRSDDQWQ